MPPRTGCTHNMAHYYSREATACKNSRLSSFLGVTPSRLNRGIRSPVISPLSIVSMTALSSFLAKAVSSGILSSSPRFASAPVHAQMVAT